MLFAIPPAVILANEFVAKDLWLGLNAKFTGTTLRLFAQFQVELMPHVNLTDHFVDDVDISQVKFVTSVQQDAKVTPTLDATPFLDQVVQH